MICSGELHPDVVAWSLEARPRPSKPPPHASQVSPWPARTPPAVVESLFPVLQSKCHIPGFRDPLLKCQRTGKVFRDATFSLPAERDVVAVPH